MCERHVLTSNNDVKVYSKCTVIIFNGYCLEGHKVCVYYKTILIGTRGWSVKRYENLKKIPISSLTRHLAMQQKLREGVAERDQ